MNSITRAAICLVLSSLACGVHAAEFNIRATLDNGDYVAGSLIVDPVSGTVVGENATLYRNGTALSTFGVPNSQGPFSVPGLEPSYLFPSQGTNNFLFVGAVPGTSLVGYAGSELCSTSSSVHCATSDLFSSGLFLANVTQGIVARKSDAIVTFALTASFENGTHVSGSVTIDTTVGYVLDEHRFCTQARHCGTVAVQRGVLTHHGPANGVDGETSGHVGSVAEDRADIEFGGVNAGRQRRQQKTNGGASD